MILTQLEEFRQAIYDGLGKARDAVFDRHGCSVDQPNDPIICQPISK
ncbi:hypothetical protein G7B40_036300 [Aetokthonos hydrillicola Thurmond2011]|jgi:hypothetical protein|uniref:Uncharacterized protein n=1 Tax=Aetokthonos hydrillicola Thurmond2011 TaxID=2712845 RepID=A0AAP5M999_9CYAN|nr:hypothetical protein [Aetokthonos hydrillicola]MBW4587407.1 hypothetical protein [Aetokthonos hydrillicola CCALA 1050]MDR9899976.1 hypothetical protein [Aetokthonos hydrillicola Thurmond2011]